MEMSVYDISLLYFLIFASNHFNCFLYYFLS